jgi:hypothetical protein
MNVLFIASMSVVAADPPQSRKLFMDSLGLPLEKYEADEYYSSDRIPGSKHFGVWPLSQAAEACFGTPVWPAGRVVPQASIEFEVEDAEAVAAAGAELEPDRRQPAAPGHGAPQPGGDLGPHRCRAADHQTVRLGAVLRRGVAGS